MNVFTNRFLFPNCRSVVVMSIIYSQRNIDFRLTARKLWSLVSDHIYTNQQLVVLLLTALSVKPHTFLYKKFWQGALRRS